MDKSVFINELKDIFNTLNKNEHRYSKVWLSDENFGGLYYSGKYVLNLRAKHKIDSYKSEVGYLIRMLREKLGIEKAAYIFNMEVFEEKEYAEPGRDDIILYTDEVAYKAA